MNTSRLLALVLSALTVIGCEEAPEPSMPEDITTFEADNGLQAPTCETNDDCEGAQVCVPSGDMPGVNYCAQLCEVDTDCPREQSCVIVQNPQTHTGETNVCGAE